MCYNSTVQKFQSTFYQMCEIFDIAKLEEEI